MKERFSPARLAALALAAAVLAVAGCGDNGISKAEMDKMKGTKPPTEAQRRQMMDGMRAGGEAHKDAQAQWAKKNPEEVARINAERAKMGRPPLPGTQ